MLKLFNNTTTKYHRFQYHPRNYDEKKKAFENKRANLSVERKENDFDVLKHYQKNKSKSAPRTDLIVLGALFFICILFSSQIDLFFTKRYKFGGLGIYFLLILLGLLFTKRSRK